MRFSKDQGSCWFSYRLTYGSKYFKYAENVANIVVISLNVLSEKVVTEEVLKFGLFLSIWGLLN